MTNAMCVPVRVMASDIDTFNRSAVSATTDLDNGLVFQLLTQDTTAANGEKEVWFATVPTTANGGLKNLWMSWSPEVVEVVSGSNHFKGIDNDPQHFTNIEGEVFDAFMPQVGDLITLTADALGGTKASASYVQVDATNNVYKLTWNTTGTLAGLSLKYVETTSISKGTAGAISETQSVVAYKFQVASIA
jgi:hypothetical protein